MGQVVNVYTGAIGETFSLASTNSAAGFATARKYKNGTESGRRATGCWITCESASIRYAFGGATATTSLGHLLEVGQAIRLTSWSEIDTISIISAVVDTPATLMVSMEF